MPFAHLSDLATQHPEIAYTSVYPDSSAPPPPAAFLSGPIPENFDDWFFSDHWVPEVRVYKIPDLTLTGDLTLNWRDYTLEIHQNGVSQQSVAEEAPHNAATTPRLIEPDTVIFPSNTYPIYGHWLVDYLPRFHALTAAGLDLTTLKFLLPGPFPPFAAIWLRLLKIPEHNITQYNARTDIITLRGALIPTNLRGYSRASPLLPTAIESLLARSKLALPAGDKKIFISRRNWRPLNRPSRRLTNIEAVEAAFQSRNFEIIQPERLSIPNQIALFRAASVIAGEYGSGLHNTIFSPPNATVIALRGTFAEPWFLQSGLCQVMGQTHGYIFGKTETLVGHQVTYIEPAHIHATLDQLGL